MEIKKGAAYIFQRNSTSNTSWNKITKLTGSDGLADANFGSDVSFYCNSNDENDYFVVIGAYYDDSCCNQGGKIYIFNRISNGSWIESNSYTLTNGEPFDLFGASVAASNSDSDCVIAGAYNKSNLTSNEGAAYIICDIFPSMAPTSIPTSMPVGMTCSEEYSCFGESIFETGGTIQCDGRAACGNSPSIINNKTASSSGRATRCLGSRSCQNVSSFYGNIANPAVLSGHLAAAWSDNIRVELDANGLWCYGEGACYNVNNMSVEAGYLDCPGLYSCANSVTSLVSTSNGRGLLSLQSSVIYSGGIALTTATGSSDSTARYRGFFSGFNGSFICESGNDCAVECEGNGCENLDYICQTGATCSVDCNDDIGIVCPNGWENNGNNYTGNFDGYSSSRSVNYYYLEQLFDDFDGYSLISDSTTSIYNTPIYSTDCGGSDAITYNSSTVTTNGGSFICADADICVGVSFKLFGNDSGNICMLSDNGGQQTTIEIENDEIDGTNKIFCDGYYGCRQTNIVGSESTRNNSNSGDIIVYARGRWSMVEANVTNFTKVFATGAGAARYSTFMDGRYIGCFGDSACQSVVINKVSKIYGAGAESLQNATIISDGVSNMEVYLLGSDAGGVSDEGAKIICNNQDNCDIYLLFNSSAAYSFSDGLNVQCDNKTDYLSCNNINVYYLNSTIPTSQPTLLPTGNVHPLRISLCAFLLVCLVFFFILVLVLISCTYRAGM